ncbi:MAG TPA: amidohydrolase family protein [Verrucomicrobiae bacterium]|jgi:predicted TIM-barrel fold metal-dependent hydrolase|nr:amidohydrolase family protein [Verrucomicrobiae bacterium]
MSTDVEREVKSLRVIDADAHVEESAETWRFLDPEFFPRRPLAAALPPDTSFGEHNAVWIIDHKLRQSAANPTIMERAQKKPISIPSQELTDVGARLSDLDRFGIEKQVIYPSAWIGCLADDPDLEAALAKSYNDFMARQCGRSGGRLYYGAVVPFRRPEAATAEIRRVADMGAAVSIFMRGVEWDMPINHPSFRPIFAEAERRGVAVAVHLGFGSPTISRMFDGMPRIKGELPFVPPSGGRLASGLLLQFAFHNLIKDCLIERYPQLRWVFLEGGSEWLIPAIRTLGRSGIECRNYFAAGRIFVSCEPDEDLSYVAAKIGEDCLVAASDMPHSDDFHHERPEETFRKTGLSEGLLQKILCGNAERLYRI